MGFFTLELARLVGSSGRVIAIDVQSKMLAGLTRRAARARINDRIDARLASKQSMNISDFVNRVDFTLAFAVVHEMPSSEVFFQEAAVAARPSSRVLFVEPGGHVSDETFTAELSSAEKAGFAVVDRPKVGHSHAVLLEKSR
jgi:ubiquinone/menaquinone biosynthesis C-methylase UbiE